MLSGRRTNTFMSTPRKKLGLLPRLVIAIALQQDGLLRLAIAQPEGELIVYLAKADTEN